jgi:glycosyltransferase involved in cell wall biosynthesis
MMQVLALTKYSYEGPSSRYRFYNYQECFQKDGIEMQIKPFFPSSYFTTSNKLQKIAVVLAAYFSRFFLLLHLLVFKKRYKWILLEYELFPYFPAIFECLLHKRGIKYIVDYDDAIFHKYDMSNNQIIKLLFKNKIAKVIKYADTTIVCNAYLEEYAKRYTDDTLRLPTVVLLDRYKAVMQSYEKRDGKFVIGWIGSRTTSSYILDILPAIERFVKSYDDVRFDLVGFDAQLLSKAELERYHLNVIEWSEEKEIEHILAFDIGIMPLDDDPWSRGKCGFKLIQYMSCKKAVVASPVGINCDIVTQGENGLWAKDVDEWFFAFEKLYQDKKLRESMSQNSWHRVSLEYNHKKNCQDYIHLLKMRY